MKMNTSISSEEEKLPVELRAVLQIFRHDGELQAKALPHVDIQHQSINWSRIWENDFGGGHAAAIIWAQAIWCDQIQASSDPFDRAFTMGPGLQQAVLRGLAIRWGFKI
jgi:hypothetical protein